MLQPYYQFCTKISKSQRERYITSVTFVEKGCSFACLVPLKKKNQHWEGIFSWHAGPDIRLLYSINSQKQFRTGISSSEHWE